MASRSRRAPVATDKRLRKSAAGGDHGTPERWQHSGRTLELTDNAGVLAVRATEEHILDVLALKRLLNDVQIEAGMRLKADYHAAALAAHTTGSYSGASSARDFFRGEYERSDAQEAAYRRWRDAMRALVPRQAAAVAATVCHDAAPRACELVMLQGGLDRLAGWYRIGK